MVHCVYAQVCLGGQVYVLYTCMSVCDGTECIFLCKFLHEGSVYVLCTYVCHCVYVVYAQVCLYENSVYVVYMHVCWG